MKLPRFVTGSSIPQNSLSFDNLKINKDDDTFNEGLINDLVNSCFLQDGSGNLGSFMVGRLGGMSVGVPDVNTGLMIRPGSTGSCTSLPPIAKVSFEHQFPIFSIGTFPIQGVSEFNR